MTDRKPARAQPLRGVQARSAASILSCPAAEELSFSGEAIAHLPPSDQVLFLRYGRGPAVTVPFACIHHAFEAQASVHPDAVAAEHQGDSITYRELDWHATRLATRLAQQGVSAGDNVGLFLQRSIPMLVGIMAVLKLGAAYVPQHLGVAPQSQLRHIIDTASIDVILTISSLRHHVPMSDEHVLIAIDDVMEEFADEKPTDVVVFPSAPTAGPDDVCFILFTSGTTGIPNGVRVTHRNVCNILLIEPGSLGMRPGAKVAQILNIAFDMAAWEILGCLAHGATLLIRGQELEPTVRAADIVIATPSILGSFDPARCLDVETVAVAGEPCPRPLADIWASFATFYNCCGPTETTIVNTMQRHDPTAARLTIGKPTPNNTVYILDADKRPCAIGEIGQMWAGGDCVSAGYLHNHALNRERYASDPFLGKGQQMFNTRDLGRWTPDGELEHLGRVDDQVKIRGFRVELDSVSTILESVPSCTKAVTLKLDDRNLVAFVSPRSTDIAAAKRTVAATLPYYCLPSLIVAMDAFPITSRGKADKRALLEIAAEHWPEAAEDAGLTAGRR